MNKRDLKQKLLFIRDGGMITPVLEEIWDELNNKNEEAKLIKSALKVYHKRYEDRQYSGVIPDDRGSCVPTLGLQPSGMQQFWPFTFGRGIERTNGIADGAD